MTDNLTALIARAQGLLLDDGTRFSTTTLTAAFRAALAKFNQTAPYFKTGTIAVVADQKDYSLSTLTGLLDFLGVWEQDASGDDDEPLACDMGWDDNAPRLRLRSALADGTLLVRYTIAHTVNGLAGSATSTLTADQDDVLVDGACAEAIRIRTVSRVEANNLSDTVAKDYAAAALAFERAFALGLARYAARLPGAGQPSTARWADEWEGWSE